MKAELVEIQCSINSASDTYYAIRLADVVPEIMRGGVLLRFPEFHYSYVENVKDVLQYIVNKINS